MKKAFTLAKDTTYVTQNDNNNVTLNFTKRTRGKYNKNVILNFTKRTNELASCVSLYAQVRSSQKIQDLSSYRFRLGGRNDSDRKELINKPSPAFVVFAKAQTQLLPLTKREGNKKRKELINLSTYPLINFQKAFTLAEVLITLGIIGIVAAMTIPALMTHFQQEQTVTKLKKALSVINQAYRLSYDDVGEPESAFNLGAEEYFKTYWAPYIKVLSYCETPESCGYKSYYPWKRYNGSSIDTLLIATTARTTFYSMDGVLYVIFTTSGDFTKPNYSIYIDINGGAGPNQIGRDVFVLTRVQKDGGGVRPYGYEQSDTNINKSCSKTGSGGFCAEKIRRAGWKIEKDYPW